MSASWRPRHACVALLLSALTAEALAATGGPLVSCAERLARTTTAVGRLRQKAVQRCVADVVACPGLLTGTPTPDSGRCLARAAARCRRRADAVRRVQARIARAGGACAARLGRDAFLGDDGLGYERLAAFCPRPPAGADGPAALLACQTDALLCTADASIGALAPRARALLARAGVALGGASGCLEPHRCGDGLVDADEECDDGPANSDAAPDACRTTCADAFCGDGTRDDGEDCDDGNRRDGDGCDAECAVESPDAVCGDGVLDADEEDCDDGNLTDGDGCDAACALEGVCGDGDVDDDEECDDGPANSNVLPGRCRRDCTAPRCGDGVVDGDDGEQCEPPGTLLCTAGCESRLPSLGPRAAAPDGGLLACQRALLRHGLRVAARTGAVVARCARTAARCLLGDGTDRCLARATRVCARATARRGALVARAAGAAAAPCRGGADALSALLRTDGGLGFAETAAGCAFAESRPPGPDDLVACVMHEARCLAERLVAEGIPRAYEAVSEVVDDVDATFPCVVDPEEIGWGDGGSVGGGFVGEERRRS